MLYPMKAAHFVDGWMDMKPALPVPKIDWIKEKRLDIPYGEDKEQKFDLYYPEQTKENMPLVVIVHGGGFTAMDKRDWHLYPGFFALRRGFTLISANYRLAPKHRFPCALEDMRLLISHIKSHAEEYRINPENIFLVGTSAGGNLVAKVALEGANGKPEYAVNSVAALCAAVDLKWINECAKTASLQLKLLARYMFTSYFGADWKKPELYEEASAVNDICKNAPPFYFLQGDKDIAVPVDSIRSYYAKLKEATGYGEEDLVLKIMEGANHAGSDIYHFEAENLEPIVDFFEKHIK